MTLVTVYVGLGSNLGEPVRQLQTALSALRRLPLTQLDAVSAFYRNPALPLPGRPQERQPDFINAVARLRTGLSAKALLRFMQRIERRQGRRHSYRWAPRTLDLDLLLFGQQRLQSAELQLPHPELWRRPFVLYPLHEIAPYLRIPGYGCVKILIQQLDQT